MPESTGSVTDLGSVRHAVEVLLWARREREKVDEKVKELEDAAKDTIRQALGDDGVRGELDGKPVVNWTKYVKRVFNQKRFREEHPTLFDAYYDEQPARTFTVVDPE